MHIETKYNLHFFHKQGKTPPEKSVQYEPPAEEEGGNKNTTYVCDVCQGKIIVGWNQWQGMNKYGKTMNKFGKTSGQFH